MRTGRKAAWAVRRMGPDGQGEWRWRLRLDAQENSAITHVRFLFNYTRRLRPQNNVPDGVNGFSTRLMWRDSRCGPSDPPPGSCQACNGEIYAYLPVLPDPPGNPCNANASQVRDWGGKGRDGSSIWYNSWPFFFSLSPSLGIACFFSQTETYSCSCLPNLVFDYVADLCKNFSTSLGRGSFKLQQGVWHNLVQVGEEWLMLRRWCHALRLSRSCVVYKRIYTYMFVLFLLTSGDSPQHLD